MDVRAGSFCAARSPATGRDGRGDDTLPGLNARVPPAGRRTRPLSRTPSDARRRTHVIGRRPSNARRQTQAVECTSSNARRRTQAVGRSRRTKPSDAGRRTQAKHERLPAWARPPDVPSAVSRRGVVARSRGAVSRARGAARVRGGCSRETEEATPAMGWLLLNGVRRRPTLPHPGECSTIGAEGLSFRVRNGTGRFPFAMTAVTLSNCQHGTPLLGCVFVVREPHSGRVAQV